MDPPTPRGCQHPIRMTQTKWACCTRDRLHMNRSHDSNQMGLLQAREVAHKQTRRQGVCQHTCAFIHVARMSLLDAKGCNSGTVHDAP